VIKLIFNGFTFLLAWILEDILYMTGQQFQAIDVQLRQRYSFKEILVLFFFHPALCPSSLPSPGSSISFYYLSTLVPNIGWGFWVTWRISHRLLSLCLKDYACFFFFNLIQEHDFVSKPRIFPMSYSFWNDLG
jgi:hypothetical protein